MMNRYDRKKGAILAALIASLALTAALAAPAAAAGGPQRVAVVNNTRFAPLAQNAVVAAGQSARFEVPSDGYGRVSLLLAGATTPGSAPGTPGAPALSLVTLYGPPVVASGPPVRSRWTRTATSAIGCWSRCWAPAW